MLLQFAEVRDRQRYNITIPVLRPRLSSYWLYFVMSTSFRLASRRLESMKVGLLPSSNNLGQLFDTTPITYCDAVRMAFQRIGEGTIISSWRDALTSSNTDESLFKRLQVPLTLLSRPAADRFLKISTAC